MSIPGEYTGSLDPVPLGTVFAKGVTLRTGQTHVHGYLRPLLERIEAGELDPSAVITHRLSLEDGPKGYEIFAEKEDECVKVILKP